MKIYTGVSDLWIESVNVDKRRIIMEIALILVIRLFYQIYMGELIYDGINSTHSRQFIDMKGDLSITRQ